MWNDWLGDEASAKYGVFGYYSLDLSLKNGKSLPTGSKLIALNTNACEALNFYLWGERSDPGHQFAWLEQQLLEVEASGGIAILMGHHTPASCQHNWGIRLRALIERF